MRTENGAAPICPPTTGSDVVKDDCPSSGAQRGHIVFWGTYDIGKPRNRILLDGLRQNGWQVTECHAHVWEGIEDKSQVKSKLRRARQILKWLFAYPGLLWRYLRLPDHDLVMVGYLGQLDVLLIRPLSWLRGKPLVWDTFLSVYDTVVDDRKLVGRRHPLARLLYAWEWLALRSADRLLVDTWAHGDYFRERFGVERESVFRVFVGVETQTFYPRKAGSEGTTEDRPYTVLFYGQFIPLHGLETIARAASLCAGENIHWQVIGDGQESERFRALLSHYGLGDLEWLPWVAYRQLIEHIHTADVCLGIFGTSDKAARVIPNKVFQVIASGRALITADTAAARELLSPGPGVMLVPPGDPAALAAAIRRMRSQPSSEGEAQLAGYRSQISPRAVVSGLADLLERDFIADEKRDGAG